MAPETGTLKDQQCKPCSGDAEPLKGDAIKKLQGQIQDEWNVEDEHHLSRTFKFDNFKQALDFTQAIGNLAEEQDHHPELQLGWGHVDVELWSHKIGGLSESDFILAAKIDELPRPQ
jgi:4a-hydroxytetrahydrobiopterin dehydratase